MGNQSGQVYGLTVLSPIKPDAVENTATGQPSHAAALRQTLADFETATGSPFAKVPTTHMARWAVIDDVFWQDYPSREEHLKSKYLFFSTNFDGELDDYLDSMIAGIPREIEQVWGHCIGFPGVGNAGEFRRYIKKCQIKTTYFFADCPEFTVERVLRSLDAQRKFVDFFAHTQGMPAEQLKSEFDAFAKELQSSETPQPGSI